MDEQSTISAIIARAGRGKGLVGRMLWLPIATCAAVGVGMYKLDEPFAILGLALALILATFVWMGVLLRFAKAHPAIAALDDGHVLEHARIEASQRQVLETGGRPSKPKSLAAPAAPGQPSRKLGKRQSNP